MLVLTRRPVQTVKIGRDITITILQIRGGEVRIGIDAPRSIEIEREEIHGKGRAARRMPGADRG